MVIVLLRRLVYPGMSLVNMRVERERELQNVPFPPTYRRGLTHDAGRAGSSGPRVSTVRRGFACPGSGVEPGRTGGSGQPSSGGYEPRPEGDPAEASRRAVPGMCGNQRLLRSPAPKRGNPGGGRRGRRCGRGGGRPAGRQNHGREVSDARMRRGVETSEGTRSRPETPGRSWWATVAGGRGATGGSG